MKLKTKLKRSLKKQMTGLKLARNYLILVSIILLGGIYAKLPVPQIVTPIAEAKELAPQPTPSQKEYTPAEVANLIVEEFKDLGPNVVKKALDIAWCESRWNEKAINNKNKNGSVDYGVFQINSIHKQSPDSMLKAEENIKFAKQMFIKNKSWGAWVCSRY